MPRIPSSFRNNLIDRVIRELNPGAEDAIFPRTLEREAIFTFPGRPVGMEWRRGQMTAASFNGVVSATSLTDSMIATTGLRYYHAAHMNHNDATAREAFLEILDPVSGLSVIVASGLISSNQALQLPRPIVIGETHRLRARLDAIGVGDQVFLRTYAANQGLGSELPGL